MSLLAGRVSNSHPYDKLFYPSGYTVQNRYTTWSGALDQVKDVASGTVHWQANARFADGQMQTMLVGNQTTSKTYDGLGRVATIVTGSLQSASYGFDALGNLTSRADTTAGQSAQSFAYDRVNRLTNDGTTSVGYDAAGNIASRNGAYTYNPSGSHRLASGGGNAYANYDLNGNVGLISNATGMRTLAYTAFNLPASVTGTSGYGSTSYLYDGSHARIREISSGAAASGTTYYLGGFEAHRRTDGVLELRHYLATPEGVVGIYTQRSNGVNDLRYWHKDHLGSIQVIADSAGSVKQGFLFDAWGNRTTRSLAGGEAYAEERSYTGHELLAEVGLIHMNGRIYDPVTGRFLQADPLVQDPFNGQSYNRYGYVLNNPLSFTDPTGFSWWTQWRRPIFAIAAATLIGGLDFPLLLQGQWVFEIGSNGFIGAIAGGFAGGGIQGGNLESAVYGALTAGAFYGVGTLANAHGLEIGDFLQPNHLAAIAGHAVVGCASAAAQGGSCKSGALSAGFAELAGPVLPDQKQFGIAGLVASAVAGGAGAALGGGKFQNGAVTGAFGYLFNECGVTRACGSDSTKVEIQGNVAGGDLLGELGTDPVSLHLSITIAGGYTGITVLSGQPRPGWFCILCLDSVRDSTTNSPVVWGPFDLPAPEGMTKSEFANALSARASKYLNSIVPYSFPQLPSGAMGPWEYNSNSWAAGLLSRTIGAVPGFSFAPYQVPGYTNPVPAWTFGR